MKRKMALMALVPLLLSSGCSNATLKFGKVTVSRPSVGTKARIGDVHMEFYEDGNPKVIDVKGYVSDQVEGLRAVAEGVAKGLAQAAKTP